MNTFVREIRVISGAYPLSILRKNSEDFSLLMSGRFSRIREGMSYTVLRVIIVP
jgi:hypothetical protein